MEAGAEILLAVDLIRMAHEARYDVAVLVAGEEDLCHAVQLAQAPHPSGRFSRN